LALFPTGNTADLPQLREADADFAAGTLRLNGRGDVVWVTGQEALRVWIRKALHLQSSRFDYPAHTAGYGNTFHTLLGCDIVTAEALLPHLLRETLLVNPYILSLRDITLHRSGSCLQAAFTVSSVYGDFVYESEDIEL